MPYITKENDRDFKLYYEDYGSGQPIILIHGWPLNGRSWELQIPFLTDLNYRVITYDRRGFGKSLPSGELYDYNALTADLHELITQLELKNVILIGFSMGGGEVVRYFTNFGSDNIDKVALVASIIPLVKQKNDNPQGVPVDDLNGILDSLKKERVTFLEQFHKNFYNYGLLSQTVSQKQLDYDWQTSSQASPFATLKTAEAWADTDFRAELQNVDKKTLIVHGDDDQIVPIETSARQAQQGIKDSTLVVIEGAPHGLNVTHADKLNGILQEFLTLS